MTPQRREKQMHPQHNNGRLELKRPGPAKDRVHHQLQRPQLHRPLLQHRNRLTGVPCQRLPRTIGAQRWWGREFPFGSADRLVLRYFCSLSLPYFRHSGQTRHQPGRQGGAPVARERWIGGWESLALARRLLVLNSAGEQYQGVLRKAGSVSNVDVGLERGRGRGALDP